MCTVGAAWTLKASIRPAPASMALRYREIDKWEVLTIVPVVTAETAAAQAKPARNLPSPHRCRKTYLLFKYPQDRLWHSPAEPKAYLPDLILVQLRVITRRVPASRSLIAYS